LIFVIHTTVAFWVLGYTAAWYTFRNPRIWRVVIPTGVVLLSVVYYYAGPKPLSLYLAGYVVLALLFVARTHLADQEKLWRAASVRYESRIWFTFLRASLLASFIALAIAWGMPTLSASAAVSDAFRDVRGPWQSFQDDWTRLFASLRSYGTAVSDPYQDTLVLGGPRSVGNTLIMDIYVPRQIPYVYWQAVVYDTYRDGSWLAAEDSETNLHFPDDGRLNVPPTQIRQVITQTVINYLPNSSTLYAAPEVVGSDKQMFVSATSNGEGHILVSSIRSRHALRQGDRYKVVSRISEVDATSLRQAPTNYPNWINATYLQVPDTVTAETIALAEELTAGLDNPFDKTIAIRDYLRNNIEYNDQIQAAPEGMDPVHYTLFVLREGYCNYYASAMSVMLRSIGVPARIASGYAQGEFHEETLSYRVRASNAHTWVEVFFPNYGWIQFEPTAALPVNDLPESPGGNRGDAFPFGDSPPELDDFNDPLGPGGLPGDLNLGPEGTTGLGDGSLAFWANFPVWQTVTAVIILAIAGVLLYVANEFNRRVETDVGRSYTRLGSWSQWLGILIRPVHTPHERADLLTTAVPEGSGPIRNLTQQFVLRQFSPAQTVEPTFEPLEQWKVLRPLLIRKGLANRVSRLRAKFRRGR
jgi:transglutaminase-like putative cysteine protease